MRLRDGGRYCRGSPEIGRIKKLRMSNGKYPERNDGGEIPRASIQSSARICPGTLPLYARYGNLLSWSPMPVWDYLQSGSKGGTTMKEITLTKGLVALVDDEDYERANQFKWHAHKIHNKMYAMRNAHKREGEPTYLHQLILNLYDGQRIDHENGNGLDDRKENLRVCTNSQNLQNRGKTRNNKSGYKGVCGKRKKYSARLMNNGRVVHLGVFLTKIEAAKAYDNAAREHHGRFAKLNFPNIHDTSIIGSLTKRLKIFIAYEDIPADGAILVFANSVKEGKRVAFPILQSWFNTEWINVKVRLLKNAEYLRKQGDARKMELLIAHC